MTSVQLGQGPNELIDNVSAEVRQKFEACRRITVLPAGTQLLTRGIPVEYVIIVNQGTVEVSAPTANASVSLAAKGAGSVFGLRCILSESCAEINVICVETCVITLLPRQEFLKIVNQHPEIYFAAARILSADLKMAVDVLRQSARSSRA